MAARLRAQGMSEVDVLRFFRTFNAGATAFREGSTSVAPGPEQEVGR